jgi:hypothetical protein
MSGIMGMSWDQVHQHNPREKEDGEQSEKLHDKLRLVLTDTFVEDYKQSFWHCYFTTQQHFEFFQMVDELQAT